MKTIRTKVYQFSELSKAAKQEAINWWKEEETFDWIYEEAFESLKAFSKVFGIDMRDYDFNEPYRSHYTFEADDTILELTGQRLATYIWNNYKDKIYSKKWYNGTIRTKPNPYHVKNKNTPEFTTFDRRSNCQIQRGNCPFTGVCYDEDLLDPIHKFCDNPNNNTTFKELLEDCLSSLNKSVEGEIIGNSEDAQVADTIMANEYHFTKDGKLFNS